MSPIPESCLLYMSHVSYIDLVEFAHVVSYTYNVCVCVCMCVIKLLRSLKTCGCLSIMCSRSFYIENFIHSDESCLAVHWLVRGNNRRGKGILFQKNEKEKQSSAFFIREHAPRRRRFLSSALCESRRKKNC